MIGRKRILLKEVISKQFSEGINKRSLFDALERFIDAQYPETKGSTGVAFPYNHKTKILHDLAFDIKQAGGLDAWKKKIMALASPVVGYLPPAKRKKQHQG